jgi:hypothetical protein
VSTDKVPAVFGMHASPKHSTESSSLPALCIGNGPSYRGLYMSGKNLSLLLGFVLQPAGQSYTAGASASFGALVELSSH